MSEDIDTLPDEPAAESNTAEPAVDKAGAENAAPADKFYIPAEDKPEEWNELYSRLGRPEAPDKYEISFREADKPFAATMQKAFFDNGLSQKAAAGLVKAWDDMQEEQAKIRDGSRAAGGGRGAGEKSGTGAPGRGGSWSW